MHDIRLLRGKPLLTALTFVMVGIFPLYLTSSQILSLDRELGFGVIQLGIGTALHFGLAAAFAQPIGLLVSRVGAPNGLRIGTALSATASVTAVMSNAPWLILVVLSLGGMANGFMQVSTNVFLARDAAFGRQGVSFAAKQGAIPLANAMAGALLPLIGVALGWRWPFGIAAMLALAAMLVAPQLNNPPVAIAGKSVEPWQGASRSLRWLALGGFCGGAAGNALSLFVVASAVDKGVTQSAAGTFLAVSAGLVFVARIGAGVTADRRGSTGHPEMIALLMVGAVGCVALALASTVNLYMIAMPIAMIGAWGWPGLAYFTVVRIHPEAPARASGVVLTGNLTGTVIGPFVVGFLADQARFSSAWTLCAALSGVAAMAMLRSRHVHKAQMTDNRPLDGSPRPDDRHTIR